jgi:hypothetical protein
LVTSWAVNGGNVVDCLASIPPICIGAAAAAAAAATRETVPRFLTLTFFNCWPGSYKEPRTAIPSF